jgi:maleylacetoacetate isomerase
MSTSPITLHGYYRSSASFRVRIALGLKGLAYEDIFHHLRRGEQRSDDYLKLNPQGLVPTLTTNGLRITQSLAIVEYLDEVFPTPALLPSTPQARALARALAQIIACDIHPIDNLRVLNYLRAPLNQTEEAVKAWYNHWITEGLAAFETLLSQNPGHGRFCVDDTPGLADICLVPQVVNAANFKLDLSPFPRILKIYDACMTLDAFRHAHPAQQPDAE